MEAVEKRKSLESMRERKSKILTKGNGVQLFGGGGGRAAEFLSIFLQKAREEKIINNKKIKYH